MKKSLLAVAAMTAFAGAAHAQSSVTVYGILDVGYVGGNEKTGAGVAETANKFTASAQSSSRLGFKGTEDLGGGLSAFFTVEMGLTPGSTSASSFNNRQTFVGLKKNGLGWAAVGTQYTPIHEAVAATGANGQNNIVGDLIYPSSSGFGQGENASSNTIAYTVRSTNMAKIATDSFAGFKGKAFYVMDGNNQNQVTKSTVTTGGTDNTTGWGLGVDYTWKKLLVTANYQSFKNETTSSSSSISTALSSSPQSSTAPNVTDNQQYYAATYDFGILKAYAQYVNRKVTSGLNSTQYASRSAQQIGVRSYLTPKIEAWASVGNGRYQAYGANQPTANIAGYQLGSNYWLSKRTNLYAIFGANGSTSTSSTTNASYNSNNYAVGVRHTF